MRDFPAIKERLAAITPGEWKAYDNTEINGAFWIGTEEFLTHAETRRGCDEVPDHVEADAAFIAHAPTDIAALVERVEELEGVLRRLSALTPNAANAATAHDLHLTVKAIADTALDDDGARCALGRGE